MHMCVCVLYTDDQVAMKCRPQIVWFPLLHLAGSGSPTEPHGSCQRAFMGPAGPFWAVTTRVSPIAGVFSA